MTTELEVYTHVIRSYLPKLLSFAVCTNSHLTYTAFELTLDVDILTFFIQVVRRSMRENKNSTNCYKRATRHASRYELNFKAFVSLN